MRLRSNIFIFIFKSLSYALFGLIERSTGANRPASGGPITLIHDLNVSYEGTEDYETPTAKVLSPM